MEAQSELLSPAGDFQTALAAFAAGADAVYCGLNDFSARAFAQNFSMAELKDLLRVAHARGKKVYVTFNTLVDEDSLEEAVSTLSHLAEAQPDGVIVQDLGVAHLCRTFFPELALHASTQLVAHNLEGVIALRELGFRRVVLARELSFAEITSIAKRCGETELECFIHGALCYSISGLCLYSALEKGRSGNRGRCAYCCRQEIEGTHPFSMKDLRLGEEVRQLVEAGVASLKIEGRMKSSLYVASVTRYYRDILDQSPKRQVSPADLETVFSRKTTPLYAHGSAQDSVIDPDSLGHVGTPIGTVKRVTRDREGRMWLRFHTSRALEKHDGLQFDAMLDGRHIGLGIQEMRSAISRVSVFEVAAGSDVEVAVPEDVAQLVHAGEAVYCSMSNAVKRLFPVPSFRASDFPGTRRVDLTVTLTPTALVMETTSDPVVRLLHAGTFSAAQNPAKTKDAVQKAFSKLGESDYCLSSLIVRDDEERFVPMRVLNESRRELVQALDAAREAERMRRVSDALRDSMVAAHPLPVVRSVKMRLGQTVPTGDWDEVVVAVSARSRLGALNTSDKIRLALPVYTPEPAFNGLRNFVKRALRDGFSRFEVADLATLRMLRTLGVTDITADWSLYAFNRAAMRTLSALGVRSFVASPENDERNKRCLAESGYAVTFLEQQSTPLFISLTKPAPQSQLSVFERDGLWVTTRPAPRAFTIPANVPTRVDLSWDPA